MQGRGKGWKDRNQQPQNIIPSPKSNKTLDLLGQPEKEAGEFHGSRNCRSNTSCCSDKGVVLAKGVLVSEQKVEKQHYMQFHTPLPVVLSPECEPCRPASVRPCSAFTAGVFSRYMRTTPLSEQEEALVPSLSVILPLFSQRGEGVDLVGKCLPPAVLAFEISHAVHWLQPAFSCGCFIGLGDV